MPVVTGELVAAKARNLLPLWEQWQEQSWKVYQVPQGSHRPSPGEGLGAGRW